MPAARSHDARGSPGAKGSVDGDENGADGQSVVGQERNRQRKSIKRAAEGSSQAATGEEGREVKKPIGRPPKRSKRQATEEAAAKTTEGNGTEPELALVSPPAGETQKSPRTRSGQKSRRRATKTLLVNGEKLGNLSEALKSSATPSRLRRRRASKEKQEVVGHLMNDDIRIKENGSKTLRSHVKANLSSSNRTGTSKGSSAAAPSEDKNGGEEDDEAGKRRRRRRKRRKSDVHSQVDDKLRIKRRVKNLVNRIRLEQNLIDAYAGEGWKGQSREKIRPEKELQRAESQILRCKLAIRESIHELDNLGLEGSLQQSAFDEEGRIYHEEIFCAKCKSQEAHVDNDIILCDGACDRGFHQECLEPPLATADIPPGDEGWLCPVCDSKVECLNYMNGYMGTEFQVEDQWEDLFAEAAAKAAGGDASNPAEEDWPSEDSEDDDYDPEKPKAVQDEDDEGKRAADSLDSLSDLGSESEATSGSTASSDDDSDDSPVSGDELVEQGARHQKRGRGNGRILDKEHIELGPQHQADILAVEEEVVAVSGKRQRKPVDYKKLHDEMFGKEDVDDDSQPSEDEEWGPGRGRRRGKAEASNGVRLDASGAESGKELEKESGKELKRRNRRKSIGAQVPNGQLLSNGQQCDDGKTYRRLPDNAVEVLRQEFDSGACFPTRIYKETLAERLSISYQQICSWFKNARHAAKIGTPAKIPRKKNNVAAVSSEGAGSGDDGIEEMEVTNGILVEKLDEVQLRLQQLKHTLEAILSSSEASNRDKHTGRPSDGTPGSGVVMQNGKRIVYVPVAEVVEKEP